MTSPPVPPQATTAERERLGRIAHDAWAAWADEQPKPWPIRRMTWEESTPVTRESFRRIGEAVAATERERLRTASNPESLGVIVREVWVSWAQEQPDPKPSWLTEWDDLDDGQREVDMRIGVILAGIGAAAERARCAQLAHKHMAWCPGKPLGPGLAEPGRFFSDVLREAQP